MLQLKRWFITVFLLLLLVAGLGFTKYTQVMAAIAFGESFPEPSETVQTEKAVSSMWRPSLEVIGDVKAMRTLEIRNELEGMITQVSLPSGGRVEEGDLLIQLDVSTEQAQLEALKAQIKLAELDVKRFSELVQSRAGSQEQLDRAAVQLAINKAQAKALQTTIDRKTIKAPFSGTTSLHQWEAGSFLSANSLITTLVGDTRNVWVDFALPQRFSDIKTGSVVRVTTRSGIDTSVQAPVTAIDQQIGERSRSLRVRATMSNEQMNLRPGSIVSVFVPIGESEQIFRLPNEALRYDTFGSYVYLLEEDSDGQYRAKRQPVESAARELDTVIISKGLKGGELVATVGSAKLTPGMLINQAGVSL